MSSIFQGGVFGHSEVVEGPHQTLAIDDHRVDTISYFDPALGYVVQRPARVSPEEAHEVELASMRHALASVEHRLATLDPNDVMPYEEPLSAEKLERKRQGLLAEREFILGKLAQLEQEPVVEAKERRRRR